MVNLKCNSQVCRFAQDGLCTNRDVVIEQQEDGSHLCTSVEPRDDFGMEGQPPPMDDFLRLMGGAGAEVPQL